MSPGQCGVASAPARASLAGNPSDGYGGAVLAVTLAQWTARASVAPAARLTVTPDSPLVEATVHRFAHELEPQALNTSVRWESAIPRDVGLAGSSALVIAVLRALSELFGTVVPPAQLADLALAVELHDLGIPAGPQDRVAQAYGGLTFMDFATGRYEPLDVRLLPPLLIAWHLEAGGPSGDIHGALGQRFALGEPEVLTAMEGLAGAARRARAALLAGKTQDFCAAVDATLDLRRSMLALDPRCVEMVEVARSFGASANYTGSGGAIVVAVARPEQLGPVQLALADRVGCQTAELAVHHTVTPR